MSLRLTHAEEVAHGEIAAFIQASIRGVNLRQHLREAKDTLGIKDTLAIAGSGTSSLRSSPFSSARASPLPSPDRTVAKGFSALAASAFAPSSVRPEQRDGASAGAIFERLGVAFRPSKRLQIEHTRMRCLVLLLLKKILGFLVGWAVSKEVSKQASE